MSVEKENIALSQTKPGSFDQFAMLLYGYLCGLAAAGWTPKDNKKIWTFMSPAQ